MTPFTKTKANTAMSVKNKYQLNVNIGKRHLTKAAVYISNIRKASLSLYQFYDQENIYHSPNVVVFNWQFELEALTLKYFKQYLIMIVLNI